jgi:hypothetical protein
MIGRHMTRMSQSSRVRLSTCAYLFAVVSIVGGALFITMALSPSDSALAASPEVSVKKIGPGYARMQPADFGKPEKLAYSPPYHPNTARPAESKVRRPAPAALAAIAPVPAAPIAQPISVAARSGYSAPDIHRIY